MSGVTLELEDPGVLAVLGHLAQRLDDMGPPLRQVGEEVLLPGTDRRFANQVDPTGTAWAPLSPAYQARKKRNADKILTLYGDLRGSFRYDVEADGLVFGTDKEYAAIHQFGGTVHHEARTATLLRGAKGNRWISAKSARRRKSWTFQGADIGAHDITMPARPFLGLSGRDRQDVLGIFRQYLAEGRT